MKKNIFDAIRNANKDDELSNYIIYEGYVLSRDYLIRNGYIGQDLQYNKSFYPIYIPGKHPTRTVDNSVITEDDLFVQESVIYNSYNFFEISKIKDNSISPNVGDRVRIYYNKAGNKAYTSSFFDIISTVDKKPTKGRTGAIVKGRVLNAHNVLPNKSVASISGGNTTRGIQTTFNDMFSQVVGQIILARNDELALNIFSVAGQESIFYSGAVGDQGRSYGYFQMNTGVHTFSHIQKYMNNAIEYLNISDFSNIKLSDLPYQYSIDEWKTSVGYKLDTYPIKKISALNRDIQLLVWVGYMIERRYIDRLTTVPVYSDITQFQQAQGFAKSLLSQYKDGTELYYNSALTMRNDRVSSVLNFAEKAKTESFVAASDSTEGYLINYFKNS